jgi:hypothetical protein
VLEGGEYGVVEVLLQIHDRSPKLPLGFKKKIFEKKLFQGRGAG